MRALVVDDEIVALKALTRRIQWEKYGVDQVFTARSMQQAQQVLKNEEIDFMLCDIEMPNGTGLDLAEWMRQHYPEIECVFITGHEDFDYARRALRLGSVDYVLKPVNYEEMDTILMKLVKSLSRKAVVESVSESIVHDLEERDSENASVIPKVKQYIIEHLSEQPNYLQFVREYLYRRSCERSAFESAVSDADIQKRREYFYFRVYDEKKDRSCGKITASHRLSC